MNEPEPDHALGPRIEHVTLRSGTRYRVFEDAGISDARVLDCDAEVKVRRLALARGEVAVYVRESGEVVLVAFEDEVRGPRAP